jgi:pimeloyl-ACP methyl ester carboxylesterase
MTEATARVCTGVDIAYETHGDEHNPALLLVMGLGGPLIWWDSEFCEQLAGHGFFVIRFDNRDIGRSTRFGGPGGSRRQMIRTFLGDRRRVPYTLANMADDAFGLLDCLGILSTHLVGVSMGGMIAQTMAISRPNRVLSMTSAMSTTGRRSVGWQDPRLLPKMLSGAATTREEYLEAAARMWELIGSPGYPRDPVRLRTRAGQTFDRGVSVDGVSRQVLAILSQPDRTEALRALDMPVLVIHGLADRLVHSSGGRATAAAIPGAELLLIPGMGHDLPMELWPMITEAIGRNAARAGVATRRSSRTVSGSS